MCIWNRKNPGTSSTSTDPSAGSAWSWEAALCEEQLFATGEQNVLSYTTRLWFPLSRSGISSNEHLCGLVCSRSELWIPDFTWKLPVTINKVIFQVDMSLNMKLPAQSFEVLFKTAQTYSGNHIGGFYTPHHFTVVHNGLTFLLTWSWHLYQQAMMPNS